MPSRWVVDPEHPEGHAVAMTAAEEKQHAKDAADGQAREDAAAAAEQGRQTVRSRIRDLAAKLENDTATQAERAELLALVARALVE